jgi:hypothetical protein
MRDTVLSRRNFARQRRAELGMDTMDTGWMYGTLQFIGHQISCILNPYYGLRSHRDPPPSPPTSDYILEKFYTAFMMSWRHAKNSFESLKLRFPAVLDLLPGLQVVWAHTRIMGQRGLEYLQPSVAERPWWGQCVFDPVEDMMMGPPHGGECVRVVWQDGVVVREDLDGTRRAEVWDRWIWYPQRWPVSGEL